MESCRETEIVKEIFFNNFFSSSVMLMIMLMLELLTFKLQVVVFASEVTLKLSESCYIIQATKSLFFRQNCLGKTTLLALSPKTIRLAEIQSDPKCLSDIDSWISDCCKVSAMSWL